MKYIISDVTFVTVETLKMKLILYYYVCVANMKEIDSTSESVSCVYV